jgi:hypothetical protein
MPDYKITQMTLAQQQVPTQWTRDELGHTQVARETYGGAECLVSHEGTYVWVRERTDSQHMGLADWHAMSSSRTTPAV